MATQEMDPSKPLLNPRWEHFAQRVVAGENLEDAYVSAGFASGAGRHASASRLNKHPQVAPRIEHLRNVLRGTATEKALVDREFVLKGLRDIAALGETESSRVRSYELLGKELGMFVDRKATVTLALKDLTKDQMAELLEMARSVLGQAPPVRVIEATAEEIPN